MAAILSLVATVLIAGAAGFFVFRGFEAGGTTAAASLAPGASGPAVGSPGASVQVASPPPASAASATDGPGSTTEPDPGDTPVPTDSATSEPTASEGPAVVTSTRFTCGNASIQDPLAGRWRIADARWTEHSAFDRVTLYLERTSGSAKQGASVTQDFIKPAKAIAQYGVAPPTGERALVITFQGPIALGAVVNGQPGLSAIKSVEARRDADGIARVVIGVTGTGCARLINNDWRDGSDATTTAQLTIDVRR
jgi:hypothetical protein